MRPELLPEGPVEPFHHPIELGRPWRKDEELDTVFLTGLLKLPIEFTSSIYLNGPHRKGALPEEFLEEHPGEVGRGLRMEGGIGPPGDKISGSELLIHLSRKGTDVQGIDGDEVSWGYHLVVSGFSLGMGSLIPPWAFCRRNPPRFLSLFEETPGLEIPEDPPHGGGRSGETLSPEEDGELPFPQEGEFLPESLNPLHKLWCPLGLPDLFGASGSSFRVLEVSGVLLFLPPKGGFGLCLSFAGDG